MPHKPADKDGARLIGARHFLAPAIDPFSSGADTERINQWDTRPDEFVKVVLGFLARGQAVMFGTSYSGDAVSVAVSVGEKRWSRRTARDEGELIGIMHELALWLQQRDIEERQRTEKPGA